MAEDQSCCLKTPLHPKEGGRGLVAQACSSCTDTHIHICSVTQQAVWSGLDTRVSNSTPPGGRIVLICLLVPTRPSVCQLESVRCCYLIPTPHSKATVLAGFPSQILSCNSGKLPKKLGQKTWYVHMKLDMVGGGEVGTCGSELAQLLGQEHVCPR